MNCREVLKQLEKFGTEQNRKVYGRHGVRGPQYGVSCRHLGQLKKQLQTDHELAVALWATGNHDARHLATMIADTARVDSRLAEQWVKEIDNYILTDAVANLVGGTRWARRKAEQWMKSKREWIGRAGWLLAAGLAFRDPELDDEYFQGLLPRIERDIHTAPNRVRDAMNMTIITIGVRSARLRQAALATAKRVGKVEVDHGATGCKTPDAAEYIARTLAYRRKKARGARP